MKKIINDLKGYEEFRGAAVDLDTDLRLVEGLLGGDREMAVELKEAVDDRLLFETMGELDALKAQFQKAAEKLKETGPIFEEYLPLELSVTKAGFNWRDPRVGAKGFGLAALSSAFSHAMVILFARIRHAGEDVSSRGGAGGTCPFPPCLLHNLGEPRGLVVGICLDATPNHTP